MHWLLPPTLASVTASFNKTLSHLKQVIKNEELKIEHSNMWIKAHTEIVNDATKARELAHTIHTNISNLLGA